MEIIDSLTLQIVVVAVLAAVAAVVTAVRSATPISRWHAPAAVEIAHQYDEELPQLLAA